MSATTLPPLREDLQLFPGPASAAGAPSFTLYDPALHRYLRIGRLEAEILKWWQLGEPARIVDAVARTTAFTPDIADVVEVLRFAERARLLRPHGLASAAGLAAQAKAARMSPAMWLLKNYLFVRVPLFNPDRALDMLSRALGFAFTRGFAAAVVLGAVLALWLIGRQWDAYTHAFLHLFSFEGAVLVALALTFAKAVHELGHGLVAKHFGCRVPSMGVALLVMWPMLWTDCTHAWRLTDNRQRLAIDAAGMAAEIVLAVAASLAWAVLADGPLRTAMFLLSSSSWLITVAVNVNPLMRFDGYFLLSDWLDVPNLQDRSFALARWRLRELLFGFGDPPPERLAPRHALVLTVYAVSCWVYRFFLFLGIAVLVYHFTFKLLGIFLMAVEVGWFVARPIVAELVVWGRRLRRAPFAVRRLVGPVLFAALIGALALPWDDAVTAPALLRAGRQVPVLVSEAGQVDRVTANGAVVAAGAVLFSVRSTDVAHDRAAALAEIDSLRAQLAGKGFDRDASQDLPKAWQSLEAAYARLRGAEARAAQLEIRAPFAGRLMDVPRDMAVGTWLPRRERLGVLIDDTAEVEAFVGEVDVERIKVGAKAGFNPEDGGDEIALVVSEIAPGAERILDEAAMASVYGGPVAAQKLSDGRMESREAVYRVRLASTKGAALAMVHRGSVRIEAPGISPLARSWRRAVAILMRELGL